MSNPNQPDLEALNAYIAEVRDTPFQWHHFDCFMFTNTAFQRMYGAGWADDWIGKYIAPSGLYMRRQELRDTFDARTLPEAIDKRLKRIDYVPPRGSLVTTKNARRWVIAEALGIGIGSSAVFVGKAGLVQLPIETISNAWVKHAA